MARPSTLTPEEEKNIKELYSLVKNVNTVASKFKRGPAFVRSVLTGTPIGRKPEKVQEGCFNWNDYKNSVI